MSVPVTTTSAGDKAVQRIRLQDFGALISGAVSGGGT
jgi:hypothetical protein